MYRSMKKEGSTLAAIDARRIISLLGLKPLNIEGGYYAETHRSRERAAADCLPRRYGGGRPLATAIYYLLTPENFSTLHRLKSDEVYHFYLGDPVELSVICPGGRLEKRVLGSSLKRGQRPQAVVERGCWQGARLAPGGRFALLGTTVSPGFEFSDFEPGKRDILLKHYPKHRRTITRLTRKPG